MPSLREALAVDERDRHLRAVARRRPQALGARSSPDRSRRAPAALEQLALAGLHVEVVDVVGRGQRGVARSAAMSVSCSALLAERRRVGRLVGRDVEGLAGRSSGRTRTAQQPLAALARPRGSPRNTSKSSMKTSSSCGTSSFQCARSPHPRRPAPPSAGSSAPPSWCGSPSARRGGRRWYSWSRSRGAEHLERERRVVGASRSATRSRPCSAQSIRM